MKLREGKFAGHDIRSVPDDYLLDLATMHLEEDPELRAAVDDERERRWRPKLHKLEKRLLDPRRSFWWRWTRDDEGHLMPVSSARRLPGAS